MERTASHRLSPESVETGDLLWAESPRWRDGRLWVSDTQGCRLVVVAPDGIRVYELDTAVNGTGFLPSGELVAARMHAARVDRFEGEAWSVHADLAELVDGRLGDLIALPDGTVYVDEVKTPTEPGRLLKVAADGRASVAAEGLVFPNGLATIDDGRTLIVAETFAGRLTAFSCGADGELEDRRIWFDLQGQLGADHLPDGIWSCRDGSVWVATTNGHAFARIHDGVVVDRIDVDGFAIACCLNDDETVLYITTATSRDPGVAVMEAAHQKLARAQVTALRLSETINHQGRG
jgi:sugar lactone lactonase YvrE